MDAESVSMWTLAVAIVPSPYALRAMAFMTFLDGCGRK
jgi:hypothetical protein